MTTAYWPDTSLIPEPSSIDVSLVSFRYKSKFENGYTQVRKKFTSSKKKFKLSWGAGDHHVLYPEHAQELMNFFDQNSGSYILWTDPRTSEEFTVVFADDELDLREMKAGSGYYGCTLTLEEV